MYNIYKKKIGTYFHAKSDDTRITKTNSTDDTAIIADVCNDGLLRQLASNICKKKKTFKIADIVGIYINMYLTIHYIVFR